MHEKQAAGLDTRMMLPVYGALYCMLRMVFLPWISVPVMKYIKGQTAYTVFGMAGFGENLQACAVHSGVLHMPPLSEAELEALHRVSQGLSAVSAVLLVCLAACIAVVLRKKSRSVKAVRLCFGLSTLYAAGCFILVLVGNMALNQRLGRPNSFMNLSLHSYVQLTSWVYAQLLVSLGLLAFGGPIMSTAERPVPTGPRSLRADAGLGKRTRLSLLLLVIAIPLVIFFGIFFLNDRSNVFIGLCIVGLAMIPFFMVFEDRQPQARELLLIAVLSAIAVVGRMAFFMLPQFKPVSAVVIIAGVGLGPEAGFLVGALSGFVSNFFFGQGPWTPWQMFAYGLMGFLAGVLFGRARKTARSASWEKRHLGLLCLYGGLATFFIYGLLLDVSAALTATGTFSWPVVAAKIISGIPFNLIHAGSTVLFLLVLARPMERKLDRIKTKYGLLRR